MKGEEALQILLEGNQRFVANALIHPNQTRQRRLDVAPRQDPLAIVLTCSDSRTPPEIIFDRGLGDLFVIRTAGNVADDVAVGSMEIAVEEFGVPLLLVLGHQRCGAIKMAMEGTRVAGQMASIVDLIRPAVGKAKGQPGDPWDNTAQENVKIAVDRLKASDPILPRKVQEGCLKIVGGYYWLDDGRVDIIVP